MTLAKLVARLRSAAVDYSPSLTLPKRIPPAFLFLHGGLHLRATRREPQPAYPEENGVDCAPAAPFRP